MLNIPQQTAAKSPGRKLFYGVPTIKRLVYWPPELLERLRSEAGWRSARAGNPEAWNVSRVVVDICLDYFGMEKPNPSKNGHADE